MLFALCGDVLFMACLSESFLKLAKKLPRELLSRTCVRVGRFEHGRRDCPLRLCTCIIHGKISCQVPVVRYVSFGPHHIATRSIHWSTKLAHMQHVFSRAP